MVGMAIVGLLSYYRDRHSIGESTIRELNGSGGEKG